MTPGWTLSKKGSGGTIDALLAAPAGSAWLCQEGDQIVVDAVTAGLPTLGMAGQAIMPKSLAHGADGYRARFEIIIDTWAGFTRFEAGDGPEQTPLALEVRPHRYKLGASAFDEMLAELSERSAGLIWGLSPGSSSGAQTPGALAVVHPVVLQSQLPRFLRLVGAYLANPPTSTVRVTRPRALDLARRPDVATLRRLGRRPALLKALQGETGAGRFADPRQSIDQPEVVASTNHPMTRYLAYLLHQLVRRFRTSEEALRTAKGRPVPDLAVEAHAARLADAMAGGARQLEALTRVPLLRSVRPEPLDGSALQSLADHPAFGAIHRFGRRLLDPGLAYGPYGDVEAALKHTYDLFEIFVLFRLIEGLPRALGPDWHMRPPRTWRSASREERTMNHAAWWFDGPDGLTIELRYQQWFPRVRRFPDERMFASLSGVGIPDYILVVRRGLKPVGWVILDAKYRSSRRAVDDGLADVHRYRDALRVRGKPADGAFVIVPHLQDEFAPYALEDFLQHHGFGVLRMLENNWLRPLANILSATGALSPTT